MNMYFRGGPKNTKLHGDRPERALRPTGIKRSRKIDGGPNSKPKNQCLSATSWWTPKTQAGINNMRNSGFCMFNSRGEQGGEGFLFQAGINSIILFYARVSHPSGGKRSPSGGPSSTVLGRPSINLVSAPQRFRGRCCCR